MPFFNVYYLLLNETYLVIFSKIKHFTFNPNQKAKEMDSSCNELSRVYV